MKQTCNLTKKDCHTCKRKECRKKLDLEVQSLFGTVTRTTRGATEMIKEIKPGWIRQ